MQNLFIIVAIAFAAPQVAPPQQPHEVLSPVTGNQNNFKPNINLELIFISDPKATPQAQVKVDLKTQQPAVNLVNLQAAKSVKCTDTKIQIEFDTLDHAQTAEKEWKELAKKGMPMVTAPIHECDGNKVAFILLKDITLNGKQIDAAKSIIPTKQIVASFKLNLNEPQKLEKRSRIRFARQ